MGEGASFLDGFTKSASEPAGRPVKMLVSAVWRAASLFLSGAMNCANGGFGTEQICRPDLNAGCAHRHRRRNAPCIRDAAGGDDRELHFPHNLRQKGERADLSSEIFRQENATVSARLETLRDDGVDAMRLEPSRLFNSCCRREYLRSHGFHPRRQFG